MKILNPIIPIVAAVALFKGTSVHGQEPVPSQTMPQLQQTMQKVASSVDQAMAEANKQFEAAERQFETILPQYQKLIQASGLDSQTAITDGPGLNEPVWVRASSSGRTIARRGVSNAPDKALVVRSADTDSAAQANLEEDLTVMLRVFDKAIDGLRGTKSPREFMGINVYFSPNLMPNRSLYLDGYGALFMMKVDFPLLAPPAAKEDQKEKTPADSSWEQARRELYGSPGNSSFTRDADQYDPDKVAKLKNALLEAFKSAVNVRNLKPDDSITVCVFGGAGQRVVEQTVSDAVKLEKGGATMVSIENAPGRGSILTMRAKKSDIDAYAKGKLTLDEFRKKTVQTVYQGGGSGMW
jgi:hypothetical protein